MQSEKSQEKSQELKIKTRWPTKSNTQSEHQDSQKGKKNKLNDEKKANLPNKRIKVQEQTKPSADKSQECYCIPNGETCGYCIRQVEVFIDDESAIESSRKKCLCTKGQKCNNCAVLSGDKKHEREKPVKKAPIQMKDDDESESEDEKPVKKAPRPNKEVVRNAKLQDAKKKHEQDINLFIEEIADRLDNDKKEMDAITEALLLGLRSKIVKNCVGIYSEEDEEEEEMQNNKMNQKKEHEDAIRILVDECAERLEGDNRVMLKTLLAGLAKSIHAYFLAK